MTEQQQEITTPIQAEEIEPSSDIDIMSYINKDKLNLINDAFNKLGMGLTLDQFLRIMLHFADISTEKKKNRLC